MRLESGSPSVHVENTNLVRISTPRAQKGDFRRGKFCGSHAVVANKSILVSHDRLSKFDERTGGQDKTRIHNSISETLR